MERRSDSLIPLRSITVLLVVLGAQFIVIIDETVVNVALPSIQRDLHLDEGQLAWVVNAYLLLFGGFLLLAGRLADLIGRRRLFLAGLVLFGVASIAAGFAGDRLVLIAARAVQGLGGAMLSPAALSILTTTFRDPRGRRLALAAWAALLGLGATLGVLLGGVIVEYLSWHWIFWVNGPIAVIVFTGCVLAVPAGRAGAEGLRGLDLPGAVLVTAAGLLLVFTVIRTKDYGWGATVSVAGLSAVAVLIAAFVYRQRRAVQPLVPAEAVVRRSAVAYPIAALAASALFAMFFFMTLYMQQVLGWSALRTGLAWAPQGITLALVTGMAVRLVPVVGVRALTASGLVIAAGAQLLLLRTTDAGSYSGQVLPALLVNALGLGLALVPLAVVAVHGLVDEQQGIASGLLSASQQLGGAVGLAVLVSIAATIFQNRLAHAVSGATAFLTAFHTALVIGAGFMIVAAVLALRLPAIHERVDMAALAA